MNQIRLSKGKKAQSSLPKKRCDPTIGLTNPTGNKREEAPSSLSKRGEAPPPYQTRTNDKRERELRALYQSQGTAPPLDVNPTFIEGGELKALNQYKVSPSEQNRQSLFKRNCQFLTTRQGHALRQMSIQRLFEVALPTSLMRSYCPHEQKERDYPLAVIVGEWDSPRPCDPTTRVSSCRRGAIACVKHSARGYNLQPLGDRHPRCLHED